MGEETGLTTYCGGAEKMGNGGVGTPLVGAEFIYFAKGGRRKKKGLCCPIFRNFGQNLAFARVYTCDNTML